MHICSLTKFATLGRCCGAAACSPRVNSTGSESTHPGAVAGRVSRSGSPGIGDPAATCQHVRSQYRHPIYEIKNLRPRSSPRRCSGALPRVCHAPEGCGGASCPFGSTSTSSSRSVWSQVGGQRARTRAKKLRVHGGRANALRMAAPLWFIGAVTPSGTVGSEPPPLGRPWVLRKVVHTLNASCASVHICMP